MGDNSVPAFGDRRWNGPRIEAVLSSLNDHLTGIEGVVSEKLQVDEPFEDMAARFAGEQGTVVLLSGGDLDCARYHILAVRPWLQISGQQGRTTVVIDDYTHDLLSPPLDVLKTVLDRCSLRGQCVELPVSAGVFGYLAYDLKDGLEDLPRTSIDDLGLPHLCLFAPSIIVVHDKTDGTRRLHATLRNGEARESVTARVEAFYRTLKAPSPTRGTFYGTASRSNFSRKDYVAAVQKIRNYITAGDVYQVNLSQRFEMGFRGDSYRLFKTLYHMNPASFFAYVNAGDHQVVSTSPERFLLRSGNRVETRPIKGTRPRGRSPETDREMKAELASSPKDDAELSMIVDLLRNDIGKVCAGGSVVVSQHKRMEAYQNVYHLVSVVEGTLADEKDSVDMIRATFPGGSITGCPKIRSMEIIDELESLRRHLYTGSIGYISFHDTMDLSIAIRTATIVGDRLVFSVGGGIVYDSDPEDEYEETLHKGRTLMSVFEGKGDNAHFEVNLEPWVWQNGRMIPQDQATVPVADLGLQYGFGFFETIRVDKGFIHSLQNHMDRFNQTWNALFTVPSPDLTWEDIIQQVLEKNGLDNTTAAVKLLATRGETHRFRFNGSLLVAARPYIHRLEATGAPGLALVTYPHPRMSPLADHKTLNYLYYYQAGVWAQEQGADEALILNPEESVSETNTANILMVDGKQVIRPRSAHVLSGTMEKTICRRLAALGYRVIDRSIQPEDLFDAQMVVLTNSLMGAVAAISLNGRPLNSDDLIATLNRGLFDVKEG